MSEHIKFPVTSVDGDKFQIIVSTEIYSLEAINASCYKFSGDFYIHQELNKQDNIVVVTLQSKDEKAVSEIVCKEFCNDLIDQQLRVTTNERFGHIRDLIVEEAFKPVNK